MAQSSANKIWSILVRLLRHTSTDQLIKTIYNYQANYKDKKKKDFRGDLRAPSHARIPLFPENLSEGQKKKEKKKRWRRSSFTTTLPFSCAALAPWVLRRGGRGIRVTVCTVVCVALLRNAKSAADVALASRTTCRSVNTSRTFIQPQDRLVWANLRFCFCLCV